MKNTIPTIQFLSAVLLLFVWIGGSLYPAWAAEPTAASSQSLPSAEKVFLELINQARQDPRAMAESIGMDPEAVAEQYPELQKMMEASPADEATDQLYQVKVADQLYQTATAHTIDMFDRQFYSADPDDIIKQSIADLGYNARYARESVAMIQFLNYIAPEEAAHILFKNLFIDDVKAGESGRCILNPNFTFVGVSIAAGVMDIGGVAANAYIVTCDFASGNQKPSRPLRLIEKQLLNCINQLRARPQDAFDLYEIDFEGKLRKIESEDPAFYHELKGEDVNGFEDGLSSLDILPLPPLTIYRNLQDAVVDHVDEMLKMELAYGFSDSMDDRTPKYRVWEYGADLDTVSESTGIIADCETLDDDSIIYNFIRYVILEEDFSPDNQVCLPVFSRDFKLAGVGVADVTEPGGECGDNVHVIAVDYGDEVVTGTTPSPEICGLVYADANGNDLYDPGEGVNEALVIVCNGEDIEQQRLQTDESGAWNAKNLSPGEYTLSLQLDDDNECRPLQWDNEQNVYVAIKIAPR